ncbi:uncharacterized protein [Macrobrachium rosenbergii]|uniref:uncharacterized protein isoform X7 n=1 Tax=Macrobrachium rosenbergii TaxID=79674 RepID=UPI0034D5D03D
MEWSKEETIRFIEAYQKRELIWDPRHVAHYNKHRKQDAWEEVAKEMGTSVDVCKKKMEYLLAALRREKMKIKKSTGTGKGVHEVYTSSWFAFDSLKFLWDKNKPKPASSTVPESEEAWRDIERGFSDHWNFPKCYGAVDGNHIEIRAPPNCGSTFCHSKKSNSIILMALVDDDYCFRCTDIGCKGSVSDGGIFQRCSLEVSL